GRREGGRYLWLTTGEWFGKCFRGTRRHGGRFNGPSTASRCDAPVLRTRVMRQPRCLSAVPWRWLPGRSSTARNSRSNRSGIAWIAQTRSIPPHIAPTSAQLANSPGWQLADMTVSERDRHAIGLQGLEPVDWIADEAQLGLFSDSDHGRPGFLEA